MRATFLFFQVFFFFANLCLASSGEYIQLGQDIDGEAAQDRCGRVALNSDGTIVAVGSGGNDNDGGVNAGHVRVFKFNSEANAFAQRGQSINGEDGSNLGESVTLSSDGNIVASGAVSAGIDNQGHVKVFQFNQSANAYEQRGEVLRGNASFDLFGYSVALSANGNILAAGGPELGSFKGYVRVF